MINSIFLLWSQSDKFKSISQNTSILKSLKSLSILWASIFAILMIFKSFIMSFFWAPFENVKLIHTGLHSIFWYELKTIFSLSFWLMLPMLIRHAIVFYFQLTGEKLLIRRVNKMHFYFVLFWIAISIGTFLGMQQFGHYFSHYSLTNSNLQWTPTFDEFQKWFRIFLFLGIIFASLPFIVYLLMRLEFKIIGYLYVTLFILLNLYFPFELESILYSLFFLVEILISISISKFILSINQYFIKRNLKKYVKNNHYDYQTL
jgi:hypothetical protein